MRRGVTCTFAIDIQNPRIPFAVFELSVDNAPNAAINFKIS